MVSAGVSGQERNSVVSASQKIVSPGGMVMWKDTCTCDKEGEERVWRTNSLSIAMAINVDSLEFTRIAKLVRWLQLQVTTSPFTSAITQPSVVHSV